MKQLRFFIAGILLCFMITAAAQTLSEQEVVDLALQHHPAIRISDLRVRQQQALERTAFNPSQPFFGIETPVDLGIGFEVEQEFDFPGEYTNRSAWLKSKTELARVEANLSRNELIREVRLAYLGAQMADRRHEYFLQQDSLWSDIADKTSRLHEAGELGRAELLFAQRQSSLMRAEAGNAAGQARLLKEVLQIYTGTPFTSPEPLRVLDYVPGTDEIYFFENYAAQQINTNTRELKVIRSEGLPDFLIGYERVAELDTEYRNRLKAGITVPIWRGQYAGEASALRTENERILAETELKIQEADLQALQWQEQLMRSGARIREYEQTILPQTDELITTYMRLYEGGEIAYSLTLKSISEASEAYPDYFEAIRLHNQAVIELDYLHNHFRN